ncbi:MAG: hypothetical protein KAI20_05380, partial [Thermoplasmatales archaeon]|nr:hypothetical protein [Thermoplasmatales archaeon]
SDVELTEVTEYWENQFPDPPAGHFLQQVIDHMVVYATRQGVRDRLMPYDPDFESVFEQTYPGRPALVKNLVEEKNDYYIVPFNSEPISWIPRAGHSDPEDDTTMVVVLVDATNGQFKEASWVHEPVVYLPITEEDALDIVLDKLEDLGYNVSELNTRAFQIDLVYRNASPYHPEWQVVIDELGLEFFVNQDGTIS